ncbi:MAG: hypothetical protein CVU63_06835 [Deltaproteobacteria bacterium HGW-Deltaproteobacteria-20]|jgi:hypothetical protein|nr:MAG: hypothetical protein CVU63_06835 [Deltaproteobacteria bacterium HGW-Deltaproteobacteria-20]
MSLNHIWTRRLLVGSAVAVSLLAVAACCKDNKEEPTTDPIPPAETTAPVEADAAAPVLANADPEWKTKCPAAERPESGTVTALRNLQIYKEPNLESNKESTIIPGTWVNLLGAKGTWYCIDYPCGVGKLCPGWIESRYSKRKEVIADAGVDAAVVKDAAVDAKDAAAPTDAATKTDGSRIRLPRFQLLDGGKKPTGTGGAPGGRPPSPTDVKPK